MLLAIDVGNTNTSVGVFDDDVLRCEFRISTRRDWTPDEIAVLLLQCLALRGIDPARDIDAAAMACVVPTASRPLTDALSDHWSIRTLVIGPGVRTGLPVKYDPPRDVGADRIVAAVAAHERYVRGENRQSGVIVVDFGTATTFDVISPAPEFIGGVIAPGVGISADALFSRAARLPRVEVERPPNVVGRNTVHAMQSGLLFGYVCLVEGMIARIREELQWSTIVVATGGLAAAIARETSAVEYVDQSLMLDGLRIIFQRNQKLGII